MTMRPAGDVLFRRLLGADTFDALPVPLRELHLHEGVSLWRGEVAVQRGSGLLARLFGWATRLPNAGAGQIEVEIVATDGGEQWTRRIAGRAMRSRLRAANHLLQERLGAVDFRFSLHSADRDILWTVAGVRLLGVFPLPTPWFSQVRARESAEGGRYRFEVAAALPFAGLLVEYRGWLHGPVA
jgi:hypothetical protein